MAIKIQGTEIIGDVTDYISLTGSTAVKVPVGLTSQRPTGVVGLLRANSETNTLEGYLGSQWTQFIDSTNSQTVTNKRIQPRVLSSSANTATPTLNTDNYDMMVITGQSVAITSFTTNLSGTPFEGQRLWIAITGTNTISISWGNSFQSSVVELPTTTTGTSRLNVGFVWSSTDNKWICVATA